MKPIKELSLFILIFLIACHPDNKSKTKIIEPDLNNYSISSIVVDKSNTKWIGTSNGLYNNVETGYALNDVSIPGKILSLFYEKNTNTLWVGTAAGLAKAGINGTDISSSVIPSANLNSAVVQAAYVDSSSKKWFGTSLGVTLNKNSTWKTSKFIVNELNKLVSMDIEKSSINSIASWDGDYFFATNLYGLYRAVNYREDVDAFSGATQWASPYNGNAAADTMFTVFVDSKAEIWMGGINGVQFYTGHDAKGNITSFISELSNIRVHAIAEAPDGKIWIGTENGIAKYDGLTSTIINDSTMKLPNKFVTAIAFDKDGSAWVGTMKGIVNIK